MNETMTLSIGGVALIQKCDAEFGYLRRVLHGLAGKAKSFVSCLKLLIHNRLTECVSTSRLRSVYGDDIFFELDFPEVPADKVLYRTYKRLGKKYRFVLEQHERFIVEEGLATDTQFMDFSSSYFEGLKALLGARGYSRDHQPGKKQITFGVSVGLNEVPAALTIQKGNVNDKSHFRAMLRIASAALPKNSLLVYDCGANTKKNNASVRSKSYHYLTLKPKKIVSYKRLIEQLRDQPRTSFVMNEQEYECSTVTKKGETTYLFFSEQKRREQLEMKARAYARELEKNKTILAKTKAGKPIAEYPTTEGVVTAKGSLQRVLTDTATNPRITGVEGYFALQSSLNTSPEYILACILQGQGQGRKVDTQHQRRNRATTHTALE